MKNGTARYCTKALWMLILVLPLIISTYSFAGTTWEEKDGRFSLDLPKKWKFKEQKTILTPDAIKKEVRKKEPDADFSGYSDEDLTGIQYKFTSKKHKASVYVVFSPPVSELTAGETFNDIISTLPDAGLTDIAPVGDVVDLDVNGNPARWGVYRGLIAGTTIPLYTFAGGVVVEKGTMNFMIMLSEGKKEKLSGEIESMFQSIRDAGAPLIGIKNRRKAKLN